MKAKGKSATSETNLVVTQTVTVRSLLVSWANEQDAWVRQLVSEIVSSGKAVSDAQLDAIYQMFLKEKALIAGAPFRSPNSLTGLHLWNRVLVCASRI
jgi:hypothetical protein